METQPAVGRAPDLDPVRSPSPGAGPQGGSLPGGGSLPYGDALPVAAGEVAGDAAVGVLPFTGLAVAALMLTGAALLTGGGALRLTAG